MKIKRTLKKILDVPNPIALETDIVNNLIAMMTGIFVGKCVDGCLVLSIDSISYYSDVSIPRNDEPTYGQIHVIANITAQMVSRGELAMVKVNKITPGQILASNDYLNCMMNKGPTLDSIVVGQTIPVRILDSKHPISKPKIYSLAELWIPSRDAVWYSIDTNLLDKKLVINLRSRMDVVEAELAKIDKKVVEKYSSILQPSPKQPSKPFVEMTIDELASSEKVVFASRDPHGNSLGDVVVVAKNDSEISNISKLSTNEGFFVLCMDYISYLQAVIAFSEYESGDHGNVIRLYQKMLAN